ncbi:MAG TPA: response regulator transcription factor [Chloroflexota bacterium]|nr:response regulator transcription factor [Chloroflexota bacterium]
MELPPRRAADEIISGTPAALRVLIADDHALLRHGIRALLREASAGDAGPIEVVAEAADGRDAVRLTLRHAPDVVLLDAEMPGYSTLEALRQIRRLPLATPPQVLILGTHAIEAGLFDLLAAGAAGLLLKEGTGTELIVALHEVRRAGFYLSPGISRKALDRWHRGTRPTRRAENDALSARERQVLHHLASGLANREIAERLSISVKTVEAHKSHMITRLGLRSAGDLLRYAAQAAPALPQMAHMGGNAHVNGGIAEN